MTNWFSEKHIWIDRAWAKYSPNQVEGLVLIAGKMANPFVHTNLVWDSDVNPEGAWMAYTHPGIAINGSGKIQPFAGVGVFQLFQSTSGHDVRLHAYQGGFIVKCDSGVKVTSAGTYYDFDHYESNNPGSGSNTGSSTNLTAREFNLLNVTNKVSWKAFGHPMSAYVDYVNNLGTEAGSAEGFAIGYKLGKNKKKGDWSVKYKYAYIPANCTVSAFNDSDFGNTNRKGHQWGGKYNIDDFLTFGLNMFYTQPVSGSTPDITEVLVLADLIWKF